MQRVRIYQSILNLKKDVPDSFRLFILELKKKHGGSIPYSMFECYYDGKRCFWITFRKDAINQLRKKFGIDSSHYKYPHFYLRKKEYKELLKEKSETYIQLYHDDEIPNNFEQAFELTPSQIKSIFGKDFELEANLNELLREIKTGNLNKIKQLQPIHLMLKNADLDSFMVTSRETKEGNFEFVIKKKSIRFEIKEPVYDKFLLTSGSVKGVEDIDNLKEIENLRGISNYFKNYLRSFIEFFRDNDYSAINKQTGAKKNHVSTIKQLFKDEDLDSYDFAALEKRTYFFNDMFLYFLSNNDLILSKSKDLSIDTEDPIKVFEESLNVMLKKGLSSFKNDYNSKVKSKDIANISRNDFSTMTSLFIDLLKKEKSFLFNEVFFTNFFYYSSILVKHFNLIKTKFQLEKTSESVPFLLALYNTASSHVKEAGVRKEILEYINSRFKKEGHDSQKGAQVLHYSRVLILLFLVAEHLKFLAEQLGPIIQPLEEIEEVLRILDEKIEGGEGFPKSKKKSFSKKLNDQVSNATDHDSIKKIDSELESVAQQIIGENDQESFDNIRHELNSLLLKKVNSIKRIDLIRENAGKIVKATLAQTIARPDIMASGTFALVIIAVGLSKQIRPYTITTLSNIDSTALPLHVKKLVNIGKKSSTQFDSFQITSEDFKEKVRITIINRLLKVFILTLIDMNKRGLEIPPLALEDLEKRFHFVSGEEKIAAYLYLIEEEMKALEKTLPDSPKKSIFVEFRDLLYKNNE